MTLNYYVQLVIEITLSRLYYQMVNRCLYIVTREREGERKSSKLKRGASKYCNAIIVVISAKCRDKSSVKL